jgi:octaprenyl-diphosphate synthase
MAGQVISSQGKLIRPGLLLLLAGYLDYRGKEKVQTAAAVEAIHMASLIHDDIIDGSPTRRGQKTAVRIFGPGLSLLLGDYFFIKSIENSMAVSSQNIPRILAKVTEQMIEGEIEELAQSYNFDLTEGQYLQIIRKKTAGLFQAICEIACILGDASREEESLMHGYGLNLGLTFQIIDDLLDLVGNPSETGKDRFSDLREGRVTLPVIIALKNCAPEMENRLKAALKKVKVKPEEKNFYCLLRLLEESQALDLTYEQAEKFAEKARKATLKLPPSVYRQSLVKLVDFVLHRKK